MDEDEFGFTYPKIDESCCIRCDRCELACPFISTKTVPTVKLPGASVAWTTRNEDLAAGTSGGVFTAIARGVLIRGGVVVGASYGDDFVVRHVAIESVSRLHEISRSKYVQSDMRGIFDDVGDFLRSGREVLFSGTPCQAYAVQTYCHAMRIDTSRLQVVDVVCHGVPTPKLLREYLAWQEAEHGSPVTGLAMRNRDFPGHYGVGTYIKVDFADGQYYRADSGSDPFGYFFLGEYSARPSCYQCPFKVLNHASDITLGDCWFSRCIAGNEGVPFEVTLCFSHSEIGQFLLENNDDIELINVDVLNAAKCNGGMLYASGKANKNRRAFLIELGKIPFGDIVARRLPSEEKPDVIRKAMKIAKQVVKAIVPQRLLVLRRLRAQDREFAKRLERIIPDEAFAERVFNN